GIIEANGGDSPGDESETGSGGRIAIYYGTDNSSIISSIGEADPKVHANGGILDNNDSLISYAGAGTVYIEHEGVDTSNQGTLLVDNVGDHPSNFDAVLTSGTYTFKEIVLTGKGNLRILGSASVLNILPGNSLSGDDSAIFTAEGDISLSGGTTIAGLNINATGDFSPNSSDVTLGSNSNLTIYANTAVRIAKALDPINQYNFGNLIVEDGGNLSLVPYNNGDANYENDYGVDLQVSSLDVKTGGVIESNSYGYAAGAGTGAGTTATGGTYAGYGAQGSGGCSTGLGSKYGSESDPQDLGSGGGGTGGAGGGVVMIESVGDVTVDGTISANGASISTINSGAGSGGSVKLISNGVFGSAGSGGYIQANGGNATGATCSAGGGGGRVSVQYSSKTYDGAIEALYGSGGVGAEGGTVYESTFNANPDEVSNLLPTNLTDGSYTNDNTPTFVFTINDSEGDPLSYHIQIDNSVGFDSAVVDYTLGSLSSGEYSFTVGQAAGDGTYDAGSESQTLSDDSYYWRVESSDAGGSSGYTTANNGEIAFILDTQPPSVPGDPSTTTPTTDNTPTWSWAESTDSDSGLAILPYNVQWCGNNSFPSPDCDGNSASVDTNSYTHGISLSDGIWYFRVKASDNAGNISEYSNYAVVEIDSTGPTKPGTPSTTTPRTDRKPTWEWTQSLDDGVPVAEYTVQWSTSSNFTSPTTDTTNTTSYTHSVDLADDRWYFRVYAFDSLGNQSSYSNTGSVVVDNTAPGVPSTPTTALSPTNDATPFIDWNSVSDNTDGSGLATIPYTIQWCTDNTFPSPDCDSYIDTSSVSSYTFLTDLADGTWYYKVKAVDKVGNESAYSDYGTVIIDTDLPDTPTNVTVDAYTQDTTPTWEWDAVYDDGDAAYISNYEIWWCDASDFLDCDANKTNVVTNSYTPGSPLADGSWYVKVKAIDSVGNESYYSDYARAIIDTVPPTPPTSFTRTTPTHDTTPRWDWSGASDSGGSGINAYIVQWCDNEAYTGCDANISNRSVNNFTLPESSEGTYYIRVKGVDRALLESDYSVSSDITIDISDPDIPGTPIADSPTMDKTPTWEWEAATAVDIDYYRLEWSQSQTFSSGVSAANSDTPTYTHTSNLADGTWYARVRARDIAGNYSEYSNTGSLVLDAEIEGVPDVPVTETPTSDTKPIWIWNEFSGESGITYQYKFEWCDNSNFSGCESNTILVSELTYTHLIDLVEGTWYARLSVVSELGVQSGFSELGEVRIDLSDPELPAIINPASKTYMNNPRPSFSWFSRYSDDVIRYRFTLNSAIEVYPVNSYAASTVNTDKYNIYYSNFNDPDPLNDIISLSTKSSSNWGAGRNNGNLSEGINSLEVIAYDGVGNFSSTEVEFFADFHAPSLQDVKINGSTDSSSKTLDTSISISGRVVDQLSGSGEKAAVGPLKVVMTINKLQGGSTTTILTAVNNFPDIYWSYNENIITDNTLNVSDKYADFSFSPSESFEAGEYQIILKAYDKLGNITETTKTLEIVGDITDLNVDELEEIIINNDNASDLINNLDSSNEGGILQNVVQGVRGVVSEGLKIISENLGGVIGGSVNYLVDLQNNLFGFSRGLRSGLLDLIRYAANELANNAEVIANTLGNFVLTHVPEVAADINRGINENVVRPLFADSYSKVVAIWDLWFDKEATAISDVQVVEKGDNYAVIEWKTNHLATSKVNYGDSLDYGESVEYDRKTKVHQVIITDLEPGQEYYYEVMSNGNNYVYDAWHKFSTTEGGNIIDPDSISIMVADAGSGGINKALQATTLGLILYFLVTIFIFNRIRTKDLRKYVN
ncbi:fibronectin type III domain-containing protein, partial [Candidatus Dojkabacteria bacterium]|nr:fibronectin type III domain-containing protein [Candidatus Dojkabacteria bacterium]